MAGPVVVVGGGIAGLAVAREVRGRGGDVLLLEASERLGGYVRSELFDGVLFEHGPQGFLGESPGVLDAVDALGLRADLVPAADAARKRWIYRGGRLVAIPTSPVAFLASSLLSASGMLRLLREPWARGAPDGPESVHAFAERRVGREAAEVLVDAMVTGILAGDPTALSVEACFPKMPRLEREHGGLFRGLRAKRKAGGSAFGSRLHSFRGGMEDLARAMAAELEGRVRCGAIVTTVERIGAGWSVRLERGETVEAAAVVLAVPARVAARLVSGVSAELAGLLAEIRCASVAVAGLVFPRERVQHPLDGYGFLVPGGRFPILGCLFESSIFAGRAPEGKVLLRAMVGGSRNPDAASRPPDVIVANALEVLRPILGIDGDPLVRRFAVHRDAIPQYDLAHPERMRRIDRALEALPGLHLAGASYRGVSVNHLVGEAAAIAAKVTGERVNAAALSAESDAS
jgi:oxygen-dependent protoporphyrinogen oxidase